MVVKHRILSYDGSFAGFLSAIYCSYESKLAVTAFRRPEETSKDIFAQTAKVETNIGHAERVMKGIISKSDLKIGKAIYTCFLSEIDGIEMKLLALIKKILKGNSAFFYNYSDEQVMELHKTLKFMRREVHRMHAFVRFQELKDGSYAAVIAPDFNVIPLIGAHFKARYPAMEWLIYDTKRDYGIHYRENEINYVNFKENLQRIDKDTLSSDEIAYQELWKQYFKSVNIPERNNTALHRRHVPLRYWKNLTEKQ